MGVAPALGISCTLSAPPAAMVAEVLPLGMASPFEVVKGGPTEITVPVAGVPSAW